MLTPQCAHFQRTNAMSSVMAIIAACIVRTHIDTVKDMDFWAIDPAILKDYN